MRSRIVSGDGPALIMSLTSFVRAGLGPHSSLRAYRQWRRVHMSTATACSASREGPGNAAPTVAAEPHKVRSYPTEPRVGVGVVILRQLTLQKADAEVLLIRRAKDPCKGLWCFPGGSLELGETLAECAVRETLEETGMVLKNSGVPAEEVYSDDLSFPTPIAAADGIYKDADGKLAYHYALIDLAAVPQNPHQQPKPADDVDAAQWFPVTQLRGMKDLVIKCDRVAEEAVRRFTIKH